MTTAYSLGCRLAGALRRRAKLTEELIALDRAVGELAGQMLPAFGGAGGRFSAGEPHDPLVVEVWRAEDGRACAHLLDVASLIDLKLAGEGDARAHTGAGADADADADPDADAA